LNIFLQKHETASNEPFYKYSWKLNPRTIEPHIEYWLAKSFAPVNGLLIVLSFFIKRAGTLRFYFFVTGMIIFAVNSFPTTIDRIKYLVSQLIESPPSLNIILHKPLEFNTYYSLVQHPLRLVKSFSSSSSESTHKHEL